MRLSFLGTAVALTCLVAGAGAQTIGVSDWGKSHAGEQAVSSWLGSTGLIVTPTAFVNAPLRLSGGFHRIEQEGTGRADVYNANVSITKDLEVGAARLTDYAVVAPLSTDLVSETVLNGKLRINLMDWFKVVGAPEVAVGVWDMTDRVNRALYVVASKALSLGAGSSAKLNAHIGFGDTERNFGPLDGLFGGVDFVPFEGTLLQLEYDAVNFNADLRYYPTPQLSADVGYIDGELCWGVSLQATK